MSLHSALQRLIEADDEAFRKCTHDKHRKAYPHAERFLRALPSWSLHELEIDFEPDGMFAFSWRSDRHNAFSVSVDEEGSLHYAIATKSIKDHGKIDAFIEVPEVIISHIKSIEMT